MYKKYSLKQVKKEINKAPCRISKIGPPTRFWGLASRLKYRTKIKNKKGR